MLRVAEEADVQPAIRRAGCDEVSRQLRQFGSWEVAKVVVVV